MAQPGRETISDMSITGYCIEITWDSKTRAGSWLSVV